MSGEEPTTEELADWLEGESPADDALHSIAAERLRALERELKEEEDLSSRQADLLTGVVNAIKGEPPERTLWSHHNAAELAAKVVAENTRLRERVAELEREQASLAADADASQHWQTRSLRAEAQLAQLRADSERLEWRTCPECSRMGAAFRRNP